MTRNYAIKPRVDALNECGVLKVSWLFKIALTLALSHVERGKDLRLFSIFDSERG